MEREIGGSETNSKRMADGDREKPRGMLDFGGEEGIPDRET